MIYSCEPEIVSIALGSIKSSEEPIPRPSTQIFVGEKASWFEINENDGTELYEDFNPDFAVKLAEWREREGAKQSEHH